MRQRTEEPCLSQAVSQTFPDRLDLLCRMEPWVVLRFALTLLPFAGVVVYGLLRSGRVWWLVAVGIGAALFTLVLEARINCSHCPEWRGRCSLQRDTRLLRCYAVYGVKRLFRYHPEPAMRWEKAVWIAGSLTLVVVPLVFLVIDGVYSLAVIGLLCVILGTITLRRMVCRRCVCFGCPMNAADDALIQSVLTQCPEMGTVWRDTGHGPY